MIFISYRREDSKAEVTHLHRRLTERFGEEHVFVDFNDIPPGEKWPDTLRQKLENSCVLLAIVGPDWGDARFATGKKKGRLRLDDPEDWVRQEICTAIRRGKETRVVVVPVDHTTLPETEWNCELDELPKLQHAPIRNQGDFERDFNQLCDWLEKQVPELKLVAESRRHVAVATTLTSMPGHPTDLAIRSYLVAEVRNHASIQLPLISQNGQPVIALINDLRIDLPLIISHEHSPINLQAGSLWIGHEILSIYDHFRSTHTNALLVDRASRFRRHPPGLRYWPKARTRQPPRGRRRSGVRKDHPASMDRPPLRIAVRQRGPADELFGGESATLAGPGLAACHDSLSGLRRATSTDPACRDPGIHLKLRQFSDSTISGFVPHFERLLEQGRAILLIDGLDEIPKWEERIEFCKFLTSIANRFPDAPIVVTSRVVGFQAVREELASRFDHLLVGPLDRSAKGQFIERWSKLIGWNANQAISLIQKVCYSRVTAKLTENIFLLAMVAQIQVLDHKVPDRRVDIYRRAVQLMLQRRRPFAGTPLSLNELIPHLEFLAYWMRKKGVQRCIDSEVIYAFRELRRLESDEPVLQTRSPEELLRACIDSVGLLNVAGTETDRRGFDRLVIQFFHQSFQEYFAGQAIKHGTDAAGSEGAVARLRDLLATIEVREREVSIFNRYKIVEPVIADYWQEAVRMGIADLKPDEADDAILMLLPGPTTPPREARPRAVFALQCLADEPPVGEQTVAAVFEAVIDCLEDSDGFNSKQNTWMDEALAAVRESVFGKALVDRFLEGFIQSREDQRDRIGCCLFDMVSEARVAVALENAETMIATATTGIAASDRTERVRAAFQLASRCYTTNGELGFLTPSQQKRLTETLVVALSADEATGSAAIWALAWLTGAANRRRGNRLSEMHKPKPTAKFALLDRASTRKVEEFLQRPSLDTLFLSVGCLVLTRENGVDLVAEQFDWIYELARVADGNLAHRLVPLPGPTGRLASVEWIRARLNTDLPMRDLASIAVTLGSFGVFVPEMIHPLRDRFLSKRQTEDARDEAVTYLGLIGGSEVASILIKAADTPPVEEDAYLYERGLLGLLLLDDIDVLAEQIRKALPHSDLNAYAYGLAGSRDPRGKVLLAQMRNDSSERIRRAVEKAFAVPWMSTDETVGPAIHNEAVH